MSADPERLLSIRILDWVDALQAHYDAHGSNTSGVSFECQAPRKDQRYVRIVMMRDGKASSVHAFYDQRTGDVYKAAGWKAPAKIVRFNLLDDESFARMIETCDWAGGYLYIR